MDSNSLIFYKYPALVTQCLASQLDWTVLSLCPLVLQGVTFQHSALLVSVLFWHHLLASLCITLVSKSLLARTSAGMVSEILHLTPFSWAHMPVSAFFQSCQRRICVLQVGPTAKSNCFDRNARRKEVIAGPVNGSVTCLTVRKLIN